MKKITIFCILLFVVSCSNTTMKQKRIEKILHGKKSILWGIYDNKLKSKKLSYTFHGNGECDYKDEYFYGDFPAKFSMPTCPEDDNWNIDVVNDSTIYLRCGLDVFRIIQYSSTYFKLFTREEDTIYLYKSASQSSQCLIPDKMPVPTW